MKNIDDQTRTCWNTHHLYSLHKTFPYILSDFSHPYKSKQ